MSKDDPLFFVFIKKFFIYLNQTNSLCIQNYLFIIKTWYATFNVALKKKTKKLIHLNLN